MSAGSSATSAADPKEIYTISTLPEAFPEVAGDENEVRERAWKRYLFYVLGYCDTYHDFAAPRDEDGGATLNLGVKGPVRSKYIIENVIDKMDSLNFRAIRDTVRGDLTFEKSMYYTFTNLINNPLIQTLSEAYRSPIRDHLSDIHRMSRGMAFQNSKIEDGDIFFRSIVGEIPASSILELRIPAIPYGSTWQKNFIDFLHKLFPSSVVEGRLRIVEDTATFPRELFTTNPVNFSRFQKLDIPQTRWDPAGLTNFNDKSMSNLLRTGGNVSAPAFRSLEKFSENTTQLFAKDRAFFQQVGAEDSLTVGKERIRELKRGPSVNHLFCHIVVHSDLTLICQGLGAKSAAEVSSKSEEIKRDAKRLINSANDPLKSRKNSTIRLIADAPGEKENPALLRKYTTSKRTGDYENANAAKFHNAVLFGGDEPEFVYAMLNEQPAIYHTSGAGGHKFRIFIPRISGQTPEQLELAQQEQTVNNYIHKTFEFTRLFSKVKGFVTSFLESITRVLSNKLIVTGSKNNDYMENLLKYMISRIILKNSPAIKRFQNASEAFGNVSPDIKAVLDKYNLTSIELTSLPDLKRVLLKSVKEKTESLEGLQKASEAVDVDMAILANIPRSLHIDTRNIRPNAMNAFRESIRKPLFYDTSDNIGLRINSPLFPELNGLNEELPVIVESFSYIHLETNLQIDELPRSVRVKLKSHRIKVKDKLSELQIPEQMADYTAEEMKGAYEASRRELDALITDFQSQKGGDNTKNNTRSNKNKNKNKLSKNTNNNTRRRSNLEKMSNLDMYEYVRESIAKVKSAPYGLTPQQYADQIVFRMIIIDSINEIEDNTTENITVPRERANSITSDPDLNLYGSFDELSLQSGGAYTQEESIEWQRLYTDIIQPFWDTVHFNEPFNIRDSMLVSIVNGSFIQSVIPFLEKFILIDPSITIQPATTVGAKRRRMGEGEGDRAAPITRMVAAAKAAYNHITRLLDHSFNDKYYIFLLKRLGDRTVEDWKTTFTNNYFRDGIVIDAFFSEMEAYFNFLTTSLQIKEKATPWTAADENAFDQITTEIGSIDTNEGYIEMIKAKKDALNLNTRYFFQTYYNLFYLNSEGDPISVKPGEVYTGPDAEELRPMLSGMRGGRIVGHERRRGKRRNSPRRISLKNREKHDTE